MAKESLFNIISSDIHGARFLDLFSGSGAIGLEALSRGASEAVFVENAMPAARAIKENIKKTGLCDKAVLMEMSVTCAVSKLHDEGRSFEIIFLDPPYDTELAQQTLTILATTGLLARGGMIIAETDKKISPQLAENVPCNLCLADTRTYGRASFMFYRGA